MSINIHPDLTEADRIVLNDLLQDVKHGEHVQSNAESGEPITAGSVDEAADEQQSEQSAGKDQVATEDAIARLKALNTQKDPSFQPTIFTIWDSKDIATSFNAHVVQPCSRVAQGIVRHPTDVVFLSHLLLYLTTVLPSAVYLLWPGCFSWTHGVAHTVFTMWCAGAFTLMLHNHIHNNGMKTLYTGRLHCWSARRCGNGTTLLT